MIVTSSVCEGTAIVSNIQCWAWPIKKYKLFPEIEEVMHKDAAKELRSF